MGKLIKEWCGIRAVETETKKPHVCEYCQTIARPQKMIKITKATNTLGYTHLECFDKLSWADDKPITKAKKSYYIPKRKTFMGKPCHTTLLLIIKEFNSVYKDVKFDVRPLEYGFRVSCTIKSKTFSENFELDYAEGIMKRRVSELLAYTLEKVEALENHP